ncbi:unnamed protein product [Durusdinium trenchii]|uniref:Peptidase A1 domain-containing protein n=1 Tax=Durusdinium trenchii TaxID=1381693 RepID=A0ABP0P4K1_9DINO
MWDLEGFMTLRDAAQLKKDNGIQSARLYGNVVSYQYYYIDILVGTPLPQRASVIADTGSTICAFTCTGCQSCGHHLDANFDFSLSTSAQWMPCDKTCSTCRHNKCAYRQSYTEGSSIEGIRFTDYVSLGDEFQQNPAVKVHMGCHTRETRLFVTQKANGIMGLAPSSSSPTILQEIFKDRAHVNAAIFSMCLAPEGGLLTVGGYNASLAAHVDWIPMRPQQFYGITLSKLAVEGGIELGTGFGRTFVDSGTTYTYLPNSLYRQLRDSVKAVCEQKCGQPAGNTCWKVSGSLEAFPRIVFTFSKNTVMFWPASSYLYRKTGDLHCLGFESNGAVPETVLGATFMINQMVVFDTQSSRLGLAHSQCPSFTQRPKPPQSVRSGNGLNTPHQKGKPAVAETLFAAFSLLFVMLGLCLVARNLLRAYGLSRRDMEKSGSPRRVRARKLGRSSPVDEEMQSLAADDTSDDNVTRVPLEAWLSATGAESDSPTAGSGPCLSEQEGR